MDIEDLQYEDFLSISKKIPRKMKFREIKTCSKTIADDYELPDIDSKAALFIASSIAFEDSVKCYEYEKKRRIKEVIEYRKTH